MSKFAVLTIAIGKDYQNLARLTHPLLRDYAAKIGADLVVIDRQKISIEWPHYEKFQIYDLLGRYSRLIYIDTDIVVRDDCPNLFDMVPENKIGMFNEGEFTDRASALAQACKDYKINLGEWNGHYYNTGVIVASRIHRELFRKPEKEIFNFFEQSYLNAMLLSSQARILPLPYAFNRMKCMDDVTGEHRLMSYMIHYAGVLENRDEIINSDIVRLRNGEHKKMKKHVLVEVGANRLGDTICAEPSIRYAIDHADMDVRFVIVSNYPAVFTHLSNRAIISDFANCRLNSDVPMKRMQTSMDETHPLRKLFNSDNMHATDYTSLLSLGRMLLPCEKMIKLHVTQNGLSQAMDILEGNSNYILVHPGKSWTSKTFPAVYWNDIIARLSKGKRKVIVIGRQCERTATVDIDVPPNVIDARDLLNTEGLIAIVGMAGTLVTNDSGPLHVAGAFPNVKIVLIPTCKHPDFILPWRMGPSGGVSQSYNIITLYRKLFGTETNLADHQIQEGDLPAVDDVCSAVLDFRMPQDPQNSLVTNPSSSPDI